ncbi:MAG: transglutaminase domain-containing protein [Candidatus Aureabacteria bacterium]|nr:transglutaminase domain-containing protein [Candidatus Auribacterota bacterium]
MDVAYKKTGYIFSYLIVFLSALYPSITMGSVMFPAVVLPVLILLFRAKKPLLRFNVNFMTYMYLSIPFVLLLRFYPSDVDNGFIMARLAYVLSQYLVSVQIMHLANPQRNSREMIFFCSVMCIICAQDVYDSNLLLHSLMMSAFFISFFFFINLRAARNLKGGVKAKYYLIISLAVIFSYLAVSLAVFSFRAFYWPVENYMMRFLWSNNISRSIDNAFTGNSMIGSLPEFLWKFNQNNVCLRIFAEKNPEYLRGKSYLYYSRGVWRNPEGGDRYLPFAGSGKENSFAVSADGEKKELRQISVFKDSDLSRTIFYGEYPFRIISCADKMKVDAFGNISDMSGKPAISYRIDELQQNDFGLKPSQCLEVPGYLKEKIREKALEISGEERDKEKIAGLIVRYFHDNYDYKLGVPLSREFDPVEEFLFNMKKGHCEYFASSAVLLLRSLDIPAAYVTGFLVTEKNAPGNYWIARNKDAHAWVEAYFEGAGWQVVEPTPPSAMPALTGKKKPFSDYYDVAVLRFQQLADRFNREGIFWFVNTLFFKVLIVILFIWYFGKMIFKKLLSLRRKPAAFYSVPDGIQGLRIKYLAMEKELRRRGVIRDKCQTLSEFSDKISGSGIEEKEKAEYISFIREYIIKRYNV